MLKDLVQCAVANPGVVAVSSVIPLGAAPPGYTTFLAAFGSAQPAFFVLADGAGKGLSGIWTVNGDGTATITSILLNHQTRGTGGETFSSACTAWNALPADSVPGSVLANATTAEMRAALSAPAIPTAVGSAVGEWRFINSGSGSSLVLPAGGTWSYWFMGVDGGGLLPGNYGAGVGAGGATVQAGVGGVAMLGFAWRIA